mgnify:FL=1
MIKLIHKIPEPNPKNHHHQSPNQKREENKANIKEQSIQRLNKPIINSINNKLKFYFQTLLLFWFDLEMKMIINTFISYQHIQPI